MSENKVLPAISGEVYFRDPEEDPPPKGAKLLILTSGNTALVSDWWDNSNFVAWSPLPSKKVGRNEVNDDYYDNYDEEIREEESNKKYRYALIAHPDCNDPDHPGCEECW
jgi:hypothetical protein